ncbi:hypothetical protein [Anatilimnocola floriformis]|uniref:hypothetical protein n=1 Tax=Anatilimnocola floriformis TaxID=2948575 RepID=UPI0020C4B864|nr:hypothetical protein [Anatilimnocola floriformis]
MKQVQFGLTDVWEIEPDELKALAAARLSMAQIAGRFGRQIIEALDRFDEQRKRRRMFFRGEYIPDPAA